MIVDSQALSLLTSLLIAGNIFSDANEALPAFVPTTPYIALAATMAVHPSMTTKTRRPEKVQASIEALQYIGLLQSTVGPVNAQFNVAYTFPNRYRLTRRGAANRRDSESPEKVAYDSITLDMAESGSLWAQAGDFWAVVGWAFNCSIKHRKRWDVWLPWLEHVVEVLKTDWQERTAVDKASECLMTKYLGEPQSRRILRAVFADGGKQSLQEFHEIWKRETTEKKDKSATYEKVKVDFETEQFGNYFNVSDEESEDEVLADFDGAADADDEYEGNFIDHISNPPIPDGTAQLGGAASLSLRMRLFALLLQLAMEMPGEFTDAESLVRLFTTYVRPLPVSTFTSIVSVAQLECFSRPAASFLMQSLACEFLESAAPRPNGDDLSQKILEQSYLPWASNANGVGDNAKLAACIETLTRLYDKEAGLKWTTKLENSAHEGVKRREEKAQKATRGKSEANTGVEEDLAWLRASGQRMSLVMKLAYRRQDTQKLDIRQQGGLEEG